MSTRDFAAEMNVLIQARLDASATYQSTAVAGEIVADLAENDPELLQGWLVLHAHELIRTAVNRIGQAQRARNRVISTRKTFGNATQKFQETGDKEVLTTWLSTPYVADENNNRLQLGEMKAQDLTFAAGYYQKLADSNAFEAQFLAALAKKVGRGKVSDQYTEEQLGQMRSSLGRMFARTTAKTA